MSKAGLPTRLWWTAPVLGLALGCASAGPWGFSREYAPLSPEEDAAAGAKTYDPVMIGRRFHEWKGKPVSVFGIVEEVGKTSSGQTDLTLSVRVLQDRNLCESASEDSCRVTVSEHEFAVLHAYVDLKPAEQSGEHRLLTGSLIRVIGPVSKDNHPKTGGPLIEASYYRHWPHKYFVTTADREYMKR